MAIPSLPLVDPSIPGGGAPRTLTPPTPELPPAGSTLQTFQLIPASIAGVMRNSVLLRLPPRSRPL